MKNSKNKLKSDSLVLTTAQEQAIVDFASEKKAIIGSSAVELLVTRDDFKEIIEELIAENQFILKKDLIEKKLIQKETKLKAREKVEIKGAGFKPLAQDIEADYRLISEWNVTGQSTSEGKIDDFLHLFRDHFNVLAGFLKQRGNLAFKPISSLKKIPKGREVNFICMIAKKWQSKNGHLCLEVEDLEAKCIALILKDDLPLNREAEKLILDDVIAIQGVKSQGDMVIIKQFFYPDLPAGKTAKKPRDLSLCVTSDLHLGSKLFLEKPFQKFLQWLKGNLGTDKDREKVSKIKYLVLAGDNVDGIGVYPEQYNELSIPDIYRQYQAFTELMKEIPEYIEVFICPGQHDAVRRADPQPAIPQEFVKELYGLKNFHFISSPGWLEIEGLKTLVYHGASLHDLYSSVSYLDATQPQKAIMDVLKRRSLMVSYGLRQPYVPEKKDFMLIREAPDIYIGGDMHHNGYGSYRGTTIINSGTWQKQTDFQVKMGHVPTPGIVPVLELQTRKITENYFYQAEEK